LLKDRLEHAIKSWIHTFSKNKETDNELAEEKKEMNDLENFVEIPTIHVELFLKNQEIFATPSAPGIRSLFLDRFHDYVSVVCSLPQASSGRFEVFDSSSTSKECTGCTYDYLLNQIAANYIAKAYDCIEVHMESVSKFVSHWFSYQTLWDTRVFEVADALGDNMELWHSVLLEASAARNALDASQSSVNFGPISIKIDKVQSQINLKYDSWQKELQSRYAEVLGQRIIALHECINATKSSLEDTDLDTSAPTDTVVSGVTLIQDTKRQFHIWHAQVEELVNAEKFLKRQRYTFKTGWVEASRIEGQFLHLEQILTKRNRSIEEQLPIIQTRVTMEDKIICSRIQDLLIKWANEKPLRGNISPSHALELISQFEAQMKKIKTDEENLIKARDALSMEGSIGNQDISIALEEISDLKEVWNAISNPHEALNKIKQTSWLSVVTRDIRKQLEDIQMTMRTMSNKIRQFDAFTHLNDTIKSYLNGHIVLSELKTDALKDRHWSALLDRFDIKVKLSELSVGLLWDHGILQRRKDINEILSIAQGEMALEVFLSQVKDRWTKQELEMVLYQNRIRLIRGWDNLFAGLDDHIGGLALMKSSPYYRSVSEFQEEGKLWDERLTKLRSTFDSWVEVQRRWVYLEGIFFGGSDIKAQLSAEWARFRNVDGEFVSLMRRISSRPYAMEVLNIENLQRTLDRLENSMIGIQRALGEYLAKQRNDFSRFYFLGDDDLLEIIGNCGEPGKVLTHLGKMFAGIVSLRSVTTDLNKDVIVKFDAMISKDGETVPLIDPIQVASKESPKAWLKKLEDGMHTTLAQLLFDAVQESSSLILNDEKSKIAFISWAKKFPAQVMILATSVNWSMSIDASLRNDGDCSTSLQSVLFTVESKLDIMATCVLSDLPADIRKKFEQLITELVHQRDVTQSLINECVNDVNDFRWLYQLRYKYNPNAALLTEKLQISLSNATFFYGFEYLGIGDRLVQTPLTDKAYLTLTQALHFRLGGNPFGPAGTGKTETVKALGAQLGRFVVVMNCDEAFDFSAMGRIFCGLCQVGAWGCFDEFNRLEERILSAVSQQILTIQRGLITRQQSIELLGKHVNLHNNVGIFVTMNPGYAGRSHLPDNLKSLFRSVAMVKPDSRLIAQVMLYSQGIVSAQTLSSKIVRLLDLCQNQMSCQSHYDFSLRALKTLVISAGALKRQQILDTKEDLASLDVNIIENDVMVQIACNNILPKLVADDLDIFPSILAEVFPGSRITNMKDDILRNAIESICKKMSYVLDDKWTQKILQLRDVLEMRHGVMLVGQSGSGKSSALHVLIRSLEQVDGKKNELYMIDPKAIDKHSLYGILDATTMEWTDGVFTSILRMILANQKGEADKRHYIVFDGDVDPEWAENLNSVLDDNKLLTLPSGERLEIPPNVRIIIEVDSLAQATPATVSRCGMVWFSEGTVSLEMSVNNLYSSLLKQDVSGIGFEIPSAQYSFLESVQSLIVPQIQGTLSLVMEALIFAIHQHHIMKPTRERFLLSLKALLVQGISQVITYNEMHPDFPMSGDHLDLFSKRWLLHSLLWSFSGSTNWSARMEFSNLLIQKSGLTLPAPGTSVADYKVRVQDGEYELWSDSVPRMEIESHQVTSSDIVITTTDTVRHSDILEAWISSRMPVILTGPPGSGKTMTLTSVLQSLQGVVMANLNFSSKTTPDLILKTFRQYCSYVRKGKDLVLEPSESLGANTWLIVFCDEINLPENDMYGTQKVIMFMRQLVEQGGFWREDNSWVKINRIQFVGACNPPTDAGRVVMSSRFLRHAPLLLVDFPARDSLLQIYGTFNGGMMKLFPNLKGEINALTNAMVQLYCDAQTQFTPDLQPQYFYSPRELSRWVRGVYESIVEMDGLTRDELVRIWAHEAQRLFCDRLVEEDERKLCENKIDLIAEENFAGVDHSKVLARPLFYSGWMSKDTRRVERDELKRFLTARLSVFYEEELDVPIVIFDDVLDHILRVSGCTVMLFQ
jgi:dynein heavy chain 1